uniref:Uncharacterized protein n=1 Tax=Arundo donax TaxID=35708 RepID=A0A0A9H792_ARUDO
MYTTKEHLPISLSINRYHHFFLLLEVLVACEAPAEDAS